MYPSQLIESFFLTNRAYGRVGRVSISTSYFKQIIQKSRRYDSPILDCQLYMHDKLCKQVWKITYKLITPYLFIKKCGKYEYVL